MNKLYRILTSVFFIGTLSFMLLIFYWVNYPYKVIEFKKVVTLKKSYKAGEPLTMKISHCKYMPIPGRVTGEFINGIVFALRDTWANASVGCETRIAIDVPVPPELNTGTYLYRQTMQYKVNPIRTISVVFETNKFEVVESTKSAELRLKGY